MGGCRGTDGMYSDHGRNASVMKGAENPDFCKVDKVQIECSECSTAVTSPY